MTLALHPNDPPVSSIGGVPCLIRNKAAYDRVFGMAASSKVVLAMRVRGTPPLWQRLMHGDCATGLVDGVLLWVLAGGRRRVWQSAG